MTKRIDTPTLERLQQGHAEIFLKTLSKQEDFCFRTFSDSPSTKNTPMNLEGAFEATKVKLAQANQMGSGVFVVINQGGQKAKDITKIRAIFADTDGAPLEPLLALEPHMVIESSPQRWHVYWLVDADFPLDQFKLIQQAIAEKFGTDKAVNDLSRVMRIPGFYHNKGAPFRTRIVKYTKDLPNYSIEALMKGLGIALETTSVVNELYNSVKQTIKDYPKSPLLSALSISKTPEIPIEILKLKSVLSFLSPDIGRGNGKFYDFNGKPLTDNWLAVIWAIRSLDWKCGKYLAIEWSKKCPERFNEAEFNQDWDNYNSDHPNPIGIGSLYMRVKELGWGDASASTPNPLRYRLLSRKDVLSQAPYTWRIKGVLPQYGVAAIYGPSGSGKSFLALDAAITIAEGGTWFGKKTCQSNVVYAALEGEAGYKNRVLAWEIQNGREIPTNFQFMLQALNLSSTQDVDDLIVAAPENPVIVIDTLNRASPIADENSSKDMGEILSSVKRIQSATNGLVIIIHHTGKDASKGLRGHSSLFAALDTAIEITSSDKQRSWKIAKSKDGESGTEFNFSLNPVHLGIDADNEPISSCTIGIGLAGIITQRPPVGKHQKPAFGAIKKAVSASGIDRISIEDATLAVSGTLTAIQTNRRNNRARALIQGLLNSGHLMADIVNGDDWISIN
jgi:hypothetical protein